MHNKVLFYEEFKKFFDLKDLIIEEQIKQKNILFKEIRHAIVNTLDQNMQNVLIEDFILNCY